MNDVTRTSKEQLRAKMRRLQQSWAKARALQQGSPDVRRDGDAIHTEALALENEIVDRLSHEPNSDQCQRADGAPELLRGTGGGSSPPSWPNLNARAARTLCAEWRPIETAPKDGTAILGFWPNNSSDRIETYQYGLTVWRGHAWFPYADPIYWMPLPAPPSSAITKSEGQS